MLNRRSFFKQTSLLAAAAQTNFLLRVARAADPDAVAAGAAVIAETSAGKVRGIAVEDVKIFKGIPYGASTAGKNRFMPPVKPAKWTGARDALAYGRSSPDSLHSVPAEPRRSH